MICTTNTYTHIRIVHIHCVTNILILMHCTTNTYTRICIVVLRFAYTYTYTLTNIHDTHIHVYMLEGAAGCLSMYVGGRQLSINCITHVGVRSRPARLASPTMAEVEAEMANVIPVLPSKLPVAAAAIEAASASCARKLLSSHIIV